MADGHLGKCKACTKLDVANRYRDPISLERIREYEKKRFKDPRRKAFIKKYRLQRNENFPGKTKARAKVSNAVRDGRLIKKPCEICGEKKVQAHHDDYRKYLEVRWLCFKHHRNQHNQLLNLT